MKMFATERRNEIKKILHDKKRMTVKELAKKVGVSEATLRADLSKMEETGILTRTHGGAIINEDTNTETSFSVRAQKNKTEKIKIAKNAFQFVKEKQCLLLDASSTALELARLIKDSSIQITIVTSGLQTAMELKDSPHITVILIGGVVTNNSTSIEGTLGIDILDYVNIDIMFTSANGFSVDRGLTDFNLYEVELKKRIVKRVKQIIALIDTSKIDVISSGVFATIDEIDTFITDSPLQRDICDTLKSHDVQLIW